LKHLSPYWKKLLQYSLIGGTTFFFDLLLYWYLRENGVYYLSAAAIAFLFSVSLNYIISRSWVFQESNRSFGAGYLYFILISTTGALLTVGGLKVLVEYEGFDPYMGRVFVGGFVGFLNYTVNYFINFGMRERVA